MELFRRLHGDGQTILLVTHDEKVAAHADRVVRMRDGKVEDPNAPEQEAAPTVRETLSFGPLLTQRPESAGETSN